MATKEAHCVKAEMCRFVGACALAEVAGQCVARTDAHCRNCDSCELSGLCVLDGGNCVAAKLEDCKKAKSCKEEGRCFVDGVSPVRIDRLLVAFGMPMGPFTLLDEVGFDIAAHAAGSLHEGYGDRMTPCDALGGMISPDRLGKSHESTHGTSAPGRDPVQVDATRRSRIAPAS